MRILKDMKHTMYTAVTAVALAVVAFSGVDAQAALVAEPAETDKAVTTVGDSITISGANNLKINGKKYTKSKIKKKVKTIKTSTNPRAVRNYAGDYYSDAIAYGNDTAAYQAAVNNFKYISLSDYKLDFLKTGTYTVSYDTYDTSEQGTYTPVAGQEYSVVSTAVKVTHHEDTYKVLQTTNPIKSIQLGKSKRTYTVKKDGAKYSVKTAVKNRYLKGTAGKLTIKTNKNYSITSAYVVTYDANNNVVVTPAANKQNVTYGVGVMKYDRKSETIDDNGNVTFTNTWGAEAPYKETEIVYGYKNDFTGSYTNFAISTKAVKIRKKDAEGKYLYKDATGAETTVYMVKTTDAEGYPAYTFNEPIYLDVTATVITKSYPTRAFSKTANAWVTAEVVEEKVVLPTSKYVDDSETYYIAYTDAEGSVSYKSAYSGEYVVVSKGGVVKPQDINYAPTEEGDAAYDQALEAYYNAFGAPYDAAGNYIEDTFVGSIGSADDSYSFFQK